MEITTTKKGQKETYSKIPLFANNTEPCAAKAVSRTIKAITLVPPTMANL